VKGVKWKEKVEAAAVAEAVAEGTTPFSFQKFKDSAETGILDPELRQRRRSQIPIQFNSDAF
jgi:hypothetical protein